MLCHNVFIVPSPIHFWIPSKHPYFRISNKCIQTSFPFSRDDVYFHVWNKIKTQKWICIAMKITLIACNCIYVYALCSKAIMIWDGIHTRQACKKNPSSTTIISYIYNIYIYHRVSSFGSVRAQLAKVVMLKTSINSEQFVEFTFSENSIEISFVFMLNFDGSCIDFINHVIKWLFCRSVVSVPSKLRN